MAKIDAIMVELTYIKEGIHDLKDLIKIQNGRVTSVEKRITWHSAYWRILIALVSFAAASFATFKGIVK